MEGGLAAASPWVRLGVLFGGPIMNLLVGFIVFVILFARLGIPDTKTVEIMDIAPASPADIAGMKAGDTIVSVNGDEDHQHGTDPDHHPGEQGQYQ